MFGLAAGSGLVALGAASPRVAGARPRIHGPHHSVMCCQKCHQLVRSEMEREGFLTNDLVTLRGKFFSNQRRTLQVNASSPIPLGPRQFMICWLLFRFAWKRSRQGDSRIHVRFVTPQILMEQVVKLNGIVRNPHFEWKKVELDDIYLAVNKLRNALTNHHIKADLLIETGSQPRGYRINSASRNLFYPDLEPRVQDLMDALEIDN